MGEEGRHKLERHLKGASAATLELLGRRLWGLPAEQSVLIVDLAIGIGAASLRPALEFLRQAPEVAPLVQHEALCIWADVAHRLAAGSAETAVQFISTTPAIVARLPADKRTLAFQLLQRQAALSSRTAVETFQELPELLGRLDDARMAAELLSIAHELARHSVKQSAELLHAAPAVAEFLRSVSASPYVGHRVVSLASGFASRSGGTASDYFARVPSVLRGADEETSVALLDETEAYLERSGGVALQFFVAGGYVLQIAGRDAFDLWSGLSRRVALQSNAATYHFLKSSPVVIADLARKAARQPEVVAEVLDIVTALAERNPLAAIECFRSVPDALASATVLQFRRWAFDGLELAASSPRRLQAYYALESRASQASLRSVEDGLRLDDVSNLLRLYLEGLTGRSLTIRSLQDLPDVSEIGDPDVALLPQVVAEFPDRDSNFRLYKVLAAFAAGQLEFGTYKRATDDLIAAFNAVALAKAGQSGTPGTPPAGIDYANVLALFENATLAHRLFTILENGRLDARLRSRYRGLRRDLEFVQRELFGRRRSIAVLPLEEVPFELLLQACLGGGVSADGRRLYGPLAERLEELARSTVHREGATVGDTLAATLEAYKLWSQKPIEAQAAANVDSSADGAGELAEGGEPEGPPDKMTPSPARAPAAPVAHWSQRTDLDLVAEAETMGGTGRVEAPEQELEPGDRAFSYDEWDRELGDHRSGWCRVIERRGTRGSRTFVDLTRSRYAGLISSIRYQFQLMRPEELTRIRGELDGDDYDLQAVVDYAVDRRARGRVSERLYTRKLRRERDVAVAFLLDMSSSTARSISRYPSQPYSHPGRRIIDIEKEGLVLMSEALEAVGDHYAMHGFTSEGRRNVKFYVFKDFEERYSVDVEQRIGGINYQNNTRLGAAIRHSAAKLDAQPNRTKLLIVLSDGRPYDHDYGDSRYAREDTKMALRRAKQRGITPFCVTIDRESEDQLRDMYGEVGYTIIDDVLSLPERMPAIYRRLTT